MAKKIHNRIALFRTEAGLSRKALAEAVGVNPQTIGFLERGDYTPSLELAMNLSDRFGVPIEMLFSFRSFPAMADVLRQVAEQPGEAA